MELISKRVWSFLYFIKTFSSLYKNVNLYIFVKFELLSTRLSRIQVKFLIDAEVKFLTKIIIWYNGKKIQETIIHEFVVYF